MSQNTQPLTGPLANIAAGAGGSTVTADPNFSETMAAYANAPNGQSSFASLLNGQTWTDAIESQWLSYIIARPTYVETADAMFPDDPSFDILDNKNWRQYTQGVSDDFKAPIARAKSVAEAVLLQQQAIENTQRTQRISEGGYGAVTANVMASFISPENVVTMGAGAGAGSGRGAGAASRTRLAINAGLVNAGSQLPIDLVRSAVDPFFGTGDVVGSFVSNAALGAASPLTRELSAVRRFAAGGVAASAGLPLQYGLTDMDAAEMRVAFATQFVLGGAFNAIPVGRSSIEADDTARIAQLAPDMQAEADVVAAATIGAQPTPKGEEVLNRVRARREAAPKAVEQTGVELFDGITEQPIVPKPAAMPVQPAASATPAPVPTTAPAAPTPSAVMPQTQVRRAPAPTIDVASLPKLPQDLAKASPRYSFGEKKFTVNFQSDIDRAAYILAQKTPSKREADYVKWLMDTTGVDEDRIREHGFKVRDRIKAIAKGRKGGTAKAPVAIEFGPLTERNFGDSQPKMPLAPISRQPQTSTPIIKTEAELRANPIIEGGDIGLGGTNVSPSLSGATNRIAPDPTYKPGDFSSQDVTFDKPEGAERIISNFAIFSQGQGIVRDNDFTAMRMAAAMVVGDMRGNNSASLLVQRHARLRSFESGYNQRIRSSLQEHNAWLATRGGSPIDQREFNRQVTQAYYADAQGIARFGSETSPAVAKEVQWHSKNFAGSLADAKRKQSPAAQAVPDGRRYLPHQWSRQKLDGAINTYGMEPVRQALIKASYPEALSDAWKAINGSQMTFAFDTPKVEAAARLAAESKADRIISNAGTHKEAITAINGLPAEESVEATFAKYRRDPALKELSDDNLRQFIMARARTPEEVVPIYKSAIELDMTARHEWTDTKDVDFGRTGPARVKTLAVTDLLEDDIASIALRYQNFHDGHLAMVELERGMASVLQRGVPVDGERPRLFLTPASASEFLRQYITDDIGEVTGRNARHIKNLEFYMKQLAGGPPIEFGTDDAANVYRMVKGAMNVTSARVMMNTTAPIQNMTELATALAQSHPAVMKKIVPTLDTTMRALANGKADSATARYAFELGMGQGLASGRPLVLMDEGNVTLQQAGQTGLSRMADATQRTAQNVSHYAYLASGNTSTQDAVEKGVLHTALAHFEMLADGELKWRAIDLEQFGLSQARLESIIADMKASRTKNSAGFYDFNEDKWQPENAAAFRRALTGWTTRYGNIKNAGLMPRYFQDSVPGQLVSQMSAFGIQSTQNRLLQPLYNIARVPAGERGAAAAQAAASYVTQSVGASMAYALGIYLASIGRPDAEEYRARMLDEKTLAMTLYSRAAWAGMSPRVADMALQATGNNPLFSPMRSTQLGSAQGLFGLAGQTPFGSYVASTLQLPNTIFAMLDDEQEVTQQQMRRLEETTLFPSAYLNLRNGLSHLYNAADIADAAELRRQRELNREVLPANNN